MMLHPTQAYHAQRLLTFIVASRIAKGHQGNSGGFAGIFKERS